MSNRRVPLGGYTRAFHDAENTDRYGKVLDGIYKAKIVSAEVKQSAKGTKYISWELEVALSSTETITIQKMNFFSDFGLSMLKGDLRAIGIDPDILDPFDRLHDILEYLSGAVIEFEQTTRANPNDLNKPYVNHNFQRLIREPNRPFPTFDSITSPSDDGFGDFEEEDEDKLPFD